MFARVGPNRFTRHLQPVLRASPNRSPRLQSLPTRPPVNVFAGPGGSNVAVTHGNEWLRAVLAADALRRGPKAAVDRASTVRSPVAHVSAPKHLRNLASNL